MPVDACIACGGAWVRPENVAHVLWEGPEIPNPESRPAQETTTGGGRFDRFAFNRPLDFVLALPLATRLRLAINATVAGLMRPFHIWIHEFGHATVAWLSGRRALPLPIGWTSWQPNRSAVVYLALLLPWGSILGAGDAGGDMDRLVFDHGWRNARIIGTYNGLGNACLLVLVGVYVAFLITQRRRIVPGLMERLGKGRSA